MFLITPPHVYFHDKINVRCRVIKDDDVVNNFYILVYYNRIILIKK